MDLTEFKTILSATFIVLGAIVFYISSLISGHNIYKDLNFNLAIMVTTIMGFIQFIFSPICFVILFPKLFGITELNSLSTSQSFTYSDVISTVNTIHSIILNYLLWDYVFLSFGLGLVFGCFSAISARAATLHWIREVTGLRYPIYTYGNTWDHLLMRVKSHGKVRLKFDNRQIEGQLVVHSVREEPNQIVLKNYRETKQMEFGLEEKNNGEILITEQSAIKEIEVPSASFNKHNDLVSHTTQSFYTALSALGVLCISTSLNLTSRFLDRERFAHLSHTYLLLSGILLIVSLIIIKISSRLYWRDFCSWAAAMVSYPTTMVVVIVALCGGGILVLSIANQLLAEPVPLLLFSFISVVGSILMTLYLLWKNTELKRLLSNVVLESSLDKEKLAEIVEEIYAEVDFNKRNCQEQVEAVLKGKNKELSDSLNKYIEAFRFLWFPQGFLKGDARNILILLRTYLSKVE